LRRFLKWLALAFLGLLAVIGALLLLIDTSAGHRLIVDRVEAMRPSSGLRIQIGRIDGSVWNRARIRDLRLSDPRGVFFESGDISLDWTPVAWWGNKLDIASVTADIATLARLPKFNPSAKKGAILPGFDIHIGQLAIKRLTIGAGVSGTARTGSLTGQADIRGGRALVKADVRTTGGDMLALNLDAEPDRNKFDIDAQLDAPTGGLFGAMIGTQRPVTARIDGDGNWAAWQGRMNATASGARVIALNLTARGGRYDVAGTLAPSLVTQGKLMRLTAPVIRVQGGATLNNRRLDTQMALTSAALAVNADGIIDLSDSSFEGMRIDARLLRPADLFPNMTGRTIQLKALLDGAFSGARFDYLLTAERAAFDATGFEQVRASGQGRWGGSPVRVPVTLTAARVTGVGDVAGGILSNLRVAGVLNVTNRLLTGDNLLLTSDKLTSRLTLLVDLTNGRYDIGLAGQLGRYLIPGLGIVDIKSTLKVVPGADGRGTRIVGRGEAWVRRFDNAFLAGLTGGLPYLETGLERGTDGILRFVNLRLRSPALQLTGNGYRRRDGTFYFEGAGTQARYGAVRLKLDGRIERPRIELQLARPMESLGLRNVQALLEPTTTGFAWRASGTSRIGPFTGTGQILLPKGGTATILVAALDASGLRGMGSLIPQSGGLSGRMMLDGSGISGTLDFAVPSNIQRIEAHLVARDARLTGPPLIMARRGRLDVVMLLDPRGTTIEGSAEGQGLRYGAMTLARLTSTAKLRDGSGEVRAAFAGSRGRTFDLQTVAQITPDRISLTGSGNVDRRAIKLDAPAILTLDRGDWVLSPTALSFAGGTARVSGRFGDAATALDATVQAMPLTVLDIVNPTLGLGGYASGQLSYNQPADGSAPTGRADLRIRNLSRAGLVLSSKPVDAGVAAVLSGSGLALRAVAASGGQTVGRAQMRIAPVSGGGALMDRLTRSPLFAQVRYSGPADTLWRLTGNESFDLSGPVALGADVGGTIDAPQIRGSFATQNARLESPVSGTLLTGLQARGNFGGSRLIIDNFSATAGRGTLAGRASFDFAAAKGVGMDISANATNAELIRRDDVSATVTGPLTIKSDGGSGVISGNVDLVRSAFRLGQANATAAIPRLNVREINRPADRADDGAPPMRWALDVKARARNQLSVTGLGLDSEWEGDLALGGTLDAMRITGRLDVLRGGYEFAGRRFDLDRGTIRFQGLSPPDPILDIQANANIQSIAATIKVIGTASKPEITFASVPALPQDELLSRLLFGTSITNLSAPEALQLAAAVTSLRGGGGLDPINAVRRAIGLDRLRIVSADATTGQKTGVAAGKYITRRTYVELISDGQGYSATRIEFQVTRWLSLLSTISTIGRQSATVRVSKDY
jgi:translocation and assembly module TamB